MVGHEDNPSSGVFEGNKMLYGLDTVARPHFLKMVFTKDTMEISCQINNILAEN